MRPPEYISTPFNLTCRLLQTRSMYSATRSSGGGAPPILKLMRYQTLPS
jgi:hypothetical protein